jgi:uracil-DNA glycosylase family 4
MADALALIGAAPVSRGVRQAPKRQTPMVQAPPPGDVSEAPRHDAVPTSPPTPSPRFNPSGATSDWRAALGGDAGGADAPAPPTEVPYQPPIDVSGAEPPRPAVPIWLAALDIPLGLTVGSPPLAPAPVASLVDVAAAVATCTACALAASARQAVPGEGNPQAGFVCVGEGPGQQEDETGRPFVGPSGELLTKILAAINFTRDDIFICNVVKHRPPGNRTPTPDEVRACRPFLEQQLALLRPHVILALGSTAATALLGTSQSLGSLRGHVHRYHGVPVVVTYHPSALLRNEAWKRPAWQDVQLARRVHDAAVAASAT